MISKIRGNKTFCIILILYKIIFFLTEANISARAQVITDTTLPNNSAVLQQENVSIISGGTQAGRNLFHSFEQFSILTGTAVHFNNSIDVQNIFTRVSGKSISSIDGLIKANGIANLFILNPNGIILGPNARLNIGGSFLATTANSVNFADRTKFIAGGDRAKPLLTVSAPIGLGFDSPGSINLIGEGHNLSYSNTNAGTPILGTGEGLTGLTTIPEKTIALVGGQVSFDGGVLTAPSGRIEIGSVSSGSVGLNLDSNSNIYLDYSSISDFKDVQLSNRSLLDASGFTNGDIFINASQVSIKNSSLVTISNFGTLSSGKISIFAPNLVELNGISDLLLAKNNTLHSQNFSAGKAADIVITTNHLVLKSLAGILAENFASGIGGSIDISSGGREQDPDKSTSEITITNGGIATLTSGNGIAGNVTLSSDRISVLNGSNLSSQTYGLGNGGSVKINASKKLEVSGVFQVTPSSFIPSFFGSLTTSFGKAGDVSVNTSQLVVSRGGRVDSSTLASGSAGTLNINATESVEVRDTVPNSLNPSLIGSSANIVDPYFSAFFGLPSQLNGTAGSININTNRLIVRDGALISVRSDGTGNAGSLSANARFIILSNSGGMAATSRSGEGGNVFLRSRYMQLRDGFIATDVRDETGNGGNITIDTDTLTALENSDITANAFQGRGGNITINAQGLFLSPDSIITASSRLGFDGTVQINDFTTNPSSGLVEQSIQPIDPSTLIAQGCPANVEEGSSFITTGRGGLPDNPYQPLKDRTIWVDLRFWEKNQPAEQSRTKVFPPKTENSTSNQSQPEALVEANTWAFNSKGEVVLTASSSNAGFDVPWLSPTSCAGL